MKRLRCGQPGFKRKLKSLLGGDIVKDDIARRVSKIIADVVKEGDKGVCRWARLLDGVSFQARDLKVSPDEIAAAVKGVSSANRKAMKEAARCIKHFHKQTLPHDWRNKNPHGAKTGENFYPLERVGLYIPGGQMPLVSTVLMTAIPARVAAVPQIAACSPPRPDGTIDPFILAAFHLCGIDEIYKIGGVQAIAALAHGTRTVSPVVKIAGPGNTYVVEAKRQLFGTVGIDLLPGPSEIMVVADNSANPDFIAAELLAQAEHGTGKELVYLAVIKEKMVDAVENSCKKQLKRLSHAASIQKVLKKAIVVIAANRQELIEVANIVAPEHLQLMVEGKQAENMARKITTAGAILLGHKTPTVLGDFTAGPSHTLPTGGTGRFSSGLQVSDFMRRTSVIEYNQKGLTAAAPVVRAFSEMEQLDAHGKSLEIRLKKK